MATAKCRGAPSTWILGSKAHTPAELPIECAMTVLSNPDPPKPLEGGRCTLGGRQEVKVQGVGRVRPSGAEHQEGPCREATGGRVQGSPRPHVPHPLPYET